MDQTQNTPDTPDHITGRIKEITHHYRRLCGDYVVEIELIDGTYEFKIEDKGEEGEEWRVVEVTEYIGWGEKKLKPSSCWALRNYCREEIGIDLEN